PDSRTTFMVAENTGAVQMPNGQVVSLAQAIQNEVVSLTGADARRGPVSRNPYLLSLELSNRTRGPLRYEIPAGALMTPAGRPSPPLPAGMTDLLAEASSQRLVGSPALQYAIWAARGQTQEDVEQTLMVKPTAKETSRAQSLLEHARIPVTFDRERGAYEKLYDAEVKKLGDAKEIEGGACL